ncbi:hypothetical protein ONZ43_g4849 [Nemania bipapillata]|uniref:Uncharacterized protein n=1 Tax=Nemania bipapillata TaxID=110536 RepID=A0ACC2IHQ9_9PEZI|nr:hypothetical protein ONZ43_g4849 [Nemania bipapillata]
MLKFSTPITTKTNFTHTGEPLCSGRSFGAIGDELGYPSLGISRYNFLRVLYENLPDHETKVKANAHAVKIETGEDGVQVHLEDGTVEYGSMVIAADGVHSPARQLIQNLLGDSNAKSPMIPGYLSLFAHTREIREDVVLGDFAESHGPGIASQCARMNDVMYFTVLKRLDEPPKDKKKFTSEDVHKFANEISEVTIFPGIKLKEIWPLREDGSATLLYQEEGMAQKWYHGRIVLVGDSAHKMTSVSGQGALAAALSAVVLVNKLRVQLQRKPDPSTKDLEATFAMYMLWRKEAVTEVLGFGAMLSRFITWANPGYEAVDRLSTSESMLADMKRKIVPGLSQSPVLDFVPFKSKRGTTPWTMYCEPA